jgi:hypothetical protein
LLLLGLRVSKSSEQEDKLQSFRPEDVSDLIPTVLVSPESETTAKFTRVAFGPDFFVKYDASDMKSCYFILRIMYVMRDFRKNGCHFQIFSGLGIIYSLSEFQSN